jgi:OOP family OmpA-OmpF porin
VQVEEKKIMHRALKFIGLGLMMGLTIAGCAKKEMPMDRQPGADAQSDSSPAPAASSQSVTSQTTSGFDITKVPISDPRLGKFPYLSLIQGYQPAKGGDNKDVAFDRYEFFDGAKINIVEGRLNTTEAEGQGSSAYQVFKTYESLIIGLGGVKVFEGTAEKMDAAGAKFSDMRHRQPVYSGDQMGVYVLRRPTSEIWVEAYVKEHYGKEGNYFLTVVEKQALDVNASLLPAEDMRKELEAKGHVALYINFDFNKADIKPDSQPIIEEIVKLLKTTPDLNLTVEGHTDNVGTPPYNNKLSEARARSVVAALVAHGIESGRLKAVGYGQNKPIADNGTDSGRAQNRRVELVKSS